MKSAPTVTSNAPPSTSNVWARELDDGSFALVFLNIGPDSANVECDSACFEQIGVYKGVNWAVRDLWTHESLKDL